MDERQHTQKLGVEDKVTERDLQIHYTQNS